MFRRPTVLVVGAGASLEAGLPIGSELLRLLARSLNLKFDPTGLREGDYLIEQALRRHVAANPHPAAKPMAEYVHAGWRIAEAAREGMSIDAIIDQHENELIEFVGKLGIAREILKAEAHSKLRARVGYDELDLDRCKDTWLPRLGRLVVENRKISSLDKAFENLTVITFNYDRCIEQYLPFSLVSHYGIALQQARELVSTLRIYHPFGTVGRLPWLPGSTPITEFGNDENSDLLTVREQIRTFTEQLEDPVTLSAMRNAIEEAERIVFLGFAYHRPNLDLLRTGAPGNAKSVFGTVIQISQHDQEVVRLETANAIGVATNKLTLLDMTCADLFDQNWRSLTA